MSTDWVPVLIVLAVGVVVGAVIAWRLRRSSRRETPGQQTEDAALRLKDLERRKRELYERLERESDAADRQLLEDQAARVLREIDRLRGELPREVAAAAAVESQPAASREARPTSGRSMLIGFVGGAAMVGLVAVLVFWAGKDARPREGGGEAAPTSMEGSEHPSPAMTADVAARIESLREQVDANPSDLGARKQLALALLGAEQFFEAFEVAQQILASRPDDPDALYVAGMVRMTMGQDDLAMELLDKVLEQYPNHIPALAGRGMIFMRRGDRDAAILVWERALEAAGGEHPDLEALLAMARNQPAPEAETAATGMPETEAAEAAAPMAVAPGSTASGGGEVAADSFGVEIDLAPGVSAPSGATLFVFLRDAAAGPPAAVKRIQAPTFPLDLDLGPGDSMMGRPLPASGTITARLDSDGSASTTSEQDLAAESEAQAGNRVRLLLDH